MDKVIKKEIEDDTPYSSSILEAVRSSSSLEAGRSSYYADLPRSSAAASIYADSVRSSSVYTATATSSGLLHHHTAHTTAPTQRVSPTSTPPVSRTAAMASMVPSLVDSTMSLSPPGGSSDYQRSVYKLKRFLSTLIKFGTDISGPVGDKVRDMIFNLVSGLLSVSDFHRQLQEVTNFPVRPYVLPFLHTNVPLLQREIQSVALSANKKVLDYLRIHEQSIFQPPLLEAGLAAEPNDIFHSEAVESHHHHRKRRTSSNSESSPLSSDPSGLAVAAAVAAAKRSKPNPGGSGLGHISPPLYHSTAPLLSSGLFPRKDMFGGGTAAIDGRKWSSLYAGKLAIVPGCPSSSNGSGLEAVKPESGTSSTSSSSLPGGPGSGAGGADDEWKNVQVMLNCILGMVEKTQRAITILQQRQSNSQQLQHQRSPEDIIDEVQTSAVRAVNEVKQNALNEISRARQELLLLRRGVSSGNNNNRTDKEAAGLLRISTSSSQSDTSEICWNCGRLGSETCSGCKVAKYCGAFCQHKDWESHHRICRAAAVTDHETTAAAIVAAAAGIGKAAPSSPPVTASAAGPLDLNCNKTSSISAEKGNEAK